MTVPAVVMSFFLILLQTGKGSIEGTVVSSTTNKPIEGAQITALRTGAAAAPGVLTGVIGGVLGGAVAGQLGGPANRLSATTDSSGRFAIQDLEPGRYLIQAAADGYARQQVGPQPAGQSGISATVTVSAGQASTGTVLHLMPGGNVSGRVTGTNGEPLAGMEVTLVRTAYAMGGQRTVSQMSNAQTNDKGEYRLFWVTPGRYYLSVSPSSRPVGAGPFMPSTANNKYPRTFYPAAPNIDSATQVDIPPGGELNGIDFRLAQQPVFRVRGRVMDSTTGQIPRSASISIMSRETIAGMAINSMSTSAPYNGVDGTFELRDVAPGSYWIRAQLPLRPGSLPPAGPVGGAGGIRPQMAIAAVDVRSSDVDNVVLTVLPPITISGRVRVEGSATAPSGGLTISLQPAPGTMMFGPMQPGIVNADGTFQMENISPGEYQFVLPGVGPVPNGANGASSLYLKEARLGAADILGQSFTILGANPGEMQVVLSSEAGEVSGAVKDDRQQGQPRIQIVLVPDRRERRDLYKQALTDPAGNFTLRAVPPGTYQIFAIDPSDMGTFFDPAVMRKYAAGARPVTIGGSSKVSVDLRVIPTPR